MNAVGEGGVMVGKQNGEGGELHYMIRGTRTVHAGPKGGFKNVFCMF